MTKTNVKSQNYSYNQLASPGKFMLFIQLLFYVIHRVLRAVTAIFSAKIIVGVYVGLKTGDYSGAYLNLILEFVCVLARSTFAWFTYVIYNKTFDISFMKISKKLIDKLLQSKTSNFSTTSNEKIQNIMVNDVDIVSYFSDSLMSNLANLVEAFIAFFVVAKASIAVALVMVVFCLINYFILKFLNKKYAHCKEKQYEAQEGVYESVNRILDSKEVINEFDADGEYEKKYLANCKKYTRSDRTRWIWGGVKDKWFFVYYKFIIAILTGVMIFLVSKGKCDVELYLVVVPYFLTITETFNGVFDITKNVEEMKVSLARINTILNFTDDEINKFGNINIKNGGVNISFVGVSYKNKDKKSPFYGELNDVDISFAEKSLNLIYGPKWCGKRLIFNMLRRKISPDKGVVLVDNININDYNSKSFNRNIYYCTAKPNFIEGSIMDNFLAITKNKKKIYSTCKKVDIYDDIKKHPNGFNSEVDDKFTRAQKFLLGLVRALLTSCNTLLIYEIPNSLTVRDKDRISSILWQISKKKTVVLFTHTDEYRQIAKTTYCIDEGKVVDIDINDNSSFCLLQKFDVSLGNNLISDTDKPIKTVKKNKK